MCVRGLRTYSTGRVIKIDIWMRQNSNEKCLNIQNTFSFSSTHMPRDKVERGERRVGAKWEAKRIESIIRIQLAFIHNPLTNVDLSEKAHKTNGHSQWIREDKNPMYWYLMHNSATCFVTLIIFVHGPTAATTTKTITRESEKSAHARMNGMEHRFRTEYKQVIWRTGVIVTSWWVVGRKRRIETHQNLNQVALNKITNWFGCQCKQDQSVAFFIISIHHAGTHSFHITYFCVCGVRLLRWALTHLR